MTEEEKKAIDKFKSRREYFKYQPEGCNWRLSFDQWEVESIIDVILNLIQKQDTEINKLNNVIDRLLRDIYECIQNDDNATILSIKDYGDYNTFEQIKDKYKEYFINNK